MNPYKKTFSKILLIISLIVLFYTFYESEIKYGGSEHDYYFKYYIISLVLVLFSFFTFFLKKKIIINILITILSILVGLYIVNAFFFFKKEKINFDERTKFEVYQDLKKQDKNIIVSMGPSLLGSNDNYPLYALSSISNKKTVHCNESGYFSIYDSDRYGFNNPDSEWEKNKIEYLLLGDSFTHGACVNEKDTISGNLRKIIRNEGVLNLGQSGNGPLLEYATLREYIQIKKVSRVLWIYTERNDLSDLNYELTFKTLVNYLEDLSFTQKLHLRQNEIDKKYIEVLNKSANEELKRQGKGKIIAFLRLYLLRDFIRVKLIKPTKNMKIEENTLEKFSEIINLSKTLSNENGSKLYFVYLPDYFRYSNKSYQNSQFKKYQNVIKIVNELNIPIIDIHKELFENYSDPLDLFPFRRFNHYSELGYNLVAKTILKKIKEYEKR